MGFDSEFEEDSDERESDVEGQTAPPTAETAALRQRKKAWPISSKKPGLNGAWRAVPCALP